MSTDDKEKKELYALGKELFDEIDMNKIYEGAIWLDKEVKRLSNQKKYDGIQGNPPKWIAGPLKKEFKAVRRFLLRWYGPPDPIQPCLSCNADKFQLKVEILCCLDCGNTVRFKPPAHEMILRYMFARKNLLGFVNEKNPPKSVRPDVCPAELFVKIDTLNYIFDLSQREEEDGPKKFLGEDAFDAIGELVRSEDGRKAAKGKAGHKGALRIALERLIEYLSVKNLDSLLEGIEGAIDDKSLDESLLEVITQDPDSVKISPMIDLYYAEVNPIDIYPERLDRDKKFFLYKERRGRKIKKIGFKRLGAIIKEIIKENPSPKK